jgi:hypothetical protein
MSDTLPPVDDAAIAKTVGAQVVLEPTGTAAQGAKGIYRHEAHNLTHLAAGYQELGLDPQDPNGSDAASEPAPPATEPPVNVDVPYASQAGDVLSCTMGNWTGEPTAYAYQWKIDGADAGTDSETYTVTAADDGGTATCVVSASNAVGTTAAPPSNGVVVTAPA